jgi:indole-3-glycerol phosphate synthase
MSRQPKRDLRRKQQRRRKVHYLQARLEKTNDSQQRQRLIAKIKKISPGSPVPAR